MSLDKLLNFSKRCLQKHYPSKQDRGKIAILNYFENHEKIVAKYCGTWYVAKKAFFLPFLLL